MDITALTHELARIANVLERIEDSLDAQTELISDIANCLDNVSGTYRHSGVPETYLRVITAEV